MDVDDFPGLARRRLAVDVLVLVGASGSGKTTLARHVLATHPDWRGWTGATLDGRPVRWDVPVDGVVLVDEIARPTDVARLAALRWRGHRLVVASHLAPAWHHPLRALGTVACVRTDDDPAKLGRWLDRRGVRWTPPTLAAFTRAYGATYTDLAIVLERVPGDDFDRSWRVFRRLHALARHPADATDRPPTAAPRATPRPRRPARAPRPDRTPPAPARAPR